MSITNLTAGSLLAPTLQKFLSGSGTYYTPAGCLYIWVRLVAGGGGAGGSGGSPGSGTSGGNTTFGTSLLVSNGGSGATGYAAGSGGTATLGSALGIAMTGSSGNSAQQNTAFAAGGSGGTSPFGGAGQGAPSSTSGGNAGPNSGSGGGGGGMGNAVGNGGGGGGAGGYIDVIITAPLANSYAFQVGSSGSGGAAGTSGSAGGAGGSGYIEVTEFYTFTGATGTSTTPATGLKNYISSVVTSNGTNALSGNFEAGSVSSFSLAHSTLSGVNPTSLATAGTAFSSLVASASGNLSVNPISSGQLAGTYSSSLVSSAASTAGDMLISNAFFIDNEDKAKVLNFKFYYSVTSGLSSLSLTGTSTNSFAVWIYDVANAAWIQPTATFSAITSGVIDSCTGSFQTSSNGTQYQLALVNINATTGAFAITLDDFQVGPGTTTQGAVITEWQAYTPTFSSGYGTLTGVDFRYRRVGDSIEITGRAVTGTSTAVASSISLPAGITVDTVKFGTNNRLVGKSTVNVSSSVGVENNIALIYNAANGTLAFTNMGDGASSNNLSPILVNNALGSGIPFTLFATAIPIAGWGAMASMGGADDAREVSAQYRTTGGVTSYGAGQVIKYTAQQYDSHAAYNSASGVYTIPSQGRYRVTVQFYGTTNFLYASLYRNGTEYARIVQIVASGQPGSQTVTCVAGDTLDIRNVSAAVSSVDGSPYNSVSFEKLVGNATIQAAESVGATYQASLGEGLAVNNRINYNVKIRDTHNAVTTGAGGGAWAFKAPVSGAYRIYANIFSPASTQIGVQIFVNGAAVAVGYEGSSTYSGSVYSQITYPLNAGDTVWAAVAGTVTLNAVGIQNTFSIEKVGN